MNKQKFFLPNPLPIDRELLAKAIFDANEYMGECKARVHYLEKYTKVLFSKLCIQEKGNKTGKEAEWHAFNHREYSKHLEDLCMDEVELFRANAMVLQLTHHQDDLRQEKALDRVKIEKGIYDVT